MKDLGEPSQFLGIKIVRDGENKVMTINQREYSEKVLEKFNMADPTPMCTRKLKV